MTKKLQMFNKTKLQNSFSILNFQIFLSWTDFVLPNITKLRPREVQHPGEYHGHRGFALCLQWGQARPDLGVLAETIQDFGCHHHETFCFLVMFTCACCWFWVDPSNINEFVWKSSSKTKTSHLFFTSLFLSFQPLNIQLILFNNHNTSKPKAERANFPTPTGTLFLSLGSHGLEQLFDHRSGWGRGSGLAPLWCLFQRPVLPLVFFRGDQFF